MALALQVQEQGKRHVYSKLSYDLETDPRPELRPLYNTCTDTNGLASKVYMDERGLLNERLPGRFALLGCCGSTAMGDVHGH